MKYEVMLGFDHSGCYQGRPPPSPTAMTQPTPLLSPSDFCPSFFLNPRENFGIKDVRLRAF